MGKSQRTKGAVFEREIAQRFSDALGGEFKRNIGQARDGGNDIDVGPLVVECKRRKTLTTLRSWMQQACEAWADRTTARVMKSNGKPVPPSYPVVVMREDGQTEPYVLLTLADFLSLAAPELQRRLRDDA